MPGVGATYVRGVECRRCHAVYSVEYGFNDSRMYQHGEFWKLLCVCGCPVSFQKAEIQCYEGQVLSRLGYAAPGECKKGPGMRAPGVLPNDILRPPA